MVKVFVAVKRKLQPGDKMAGRHGNKGVVSRVTPLEDMPFLDDGTPGGPGAQPARRASRMNVGADPGNASGLGLRQSRPRSGRAGGGIPPHRAEAAGTAGLAEGYLQRAGVHAAHRADEQRAAHGAGGQPEEGDPDRHPVFDGGMSDIEGMLTKAGLATSGQVQLTDGRTGEGFERKVTVGYIYMLKLHHLVDDKIHARSIGPYSLVTQQPLGGKAQFGGQRFGEMEVWALEAYGAAYTLQEMLTVKSDDVSGRTKVYEAIVREQDNFEAGIPESFNVLVKELKSLGLNVDLDTIA
ncbi:MAG: hypothetical protein WDN49_10955 [Acetobacteraceae bacterium]